jgi:hypothetical protein
MLGEAFGAPLIACVVGFVNDKGCKCVLSACIVFDLDQLVS